MANHAFSTISFLLKHFLPQITVMGNLSFDLGTSWRSSGEMDMKEWEL